MGDLEPVTRTNSLLIPSIALGYVPFVIIVLMFYSHSSPDETLPGFEFLIFSSMCLVPTTANLCIISLQDNSAEKRK